MPWFRLDDRLHCHPKWVKCSHRARSLWSSAASWAGGQGADGIVPRHMLATWGNTVRDAHELESAGLWDAHDDGWVFHNWADFQPTAEQVEADRAAARERQRRARDKARESRVTNGASHGSVTVPPSRPVPSSTTHVSTPPPQADIEADDEMKQEAHRRTMAVARAGRLQGTFAAYERVVLAGLVKEGWKPGPPPPVTPQEALPDVETVKAAHSVSWEDAAAPPKRQGLKIEQEAS